MKKNLLRNENILAHQKTGATNKVGGTNLANESRKLFKEFLIYELEKLEQLQESNSENYLYSVFKSSCSCTNSTFFILDCPMFLNDSKSFWISQELYNQIENQFQNGQNVALVYKKVNNLVKACSKFRFIIVNTILLEKLSEATEVNYSITNILSLRQVELL
jgi:hypothetical protein